MHSRPLQRLLAPAIAIALTAPAGAGALPDAPAVPASCGVQLKTHNFSIETLDKAHEMGFQIIRRGFYWDSVEKQKGVYTFDAYDKEMAHAKKLGLTVVGCLFGGNKLHEDDGRGGIQTEAGRQGFAGFAAALAEHYKDQPIIWEVWNEPNVRTFWRKDGTHNTKPFAEEYTALVKAVAPAIHKANPDAIVAAGSVSNYWKPSYEWTEFCFDLGILDSGINTWSVHPYGVRTPEEFAAGHGITRELLKKYGKPDLPMINTERGFAVKKMDEGWSGGSLDRAREFQAWHFVRQQMADMMHDVRLTVWYEWDGKGKWTGDAFALTSDDEERPVAAAARVMMQTLDGYRFVKRIDTGYGLDYVLLFENEAGEKKLVAWTAPPAGDVPDLAYAHEVSINTSVPGTVTAIGISGGELAVKPDGNAYRLAVSGAPQYVTIPSSSQVTAKSVEPYKAPIKAADAPPASAVDLKLFESDSQWEFLKNTGDGMLEITAAGEKQIGVLHYDFTKSTSKGRPYVLAMADVQVPAGATKVLIYARSPIRQQLTFRLLDETGQTHQYKGRLQGTGQWEQIAISLTRRLEHWGGANDGKVHFPITKLFLSLPLPDDEHKMGKVEYTDIMAVMGADAPAPAATTPPAALEGAMDLKLFAGNTDWTFQKNTGEGSWELAKAADGTPIGVINYDFTSSNSRGTPYVLTSAKVNIPAGGKSLTIKARSDVAQKLTFRVSDATGQTHQYKGKISGTGDWETITIPLTRRLEHWGGANDGQIHYPIEGMTFSVPLPSQDHKAGKVEYANVSVQ